MRTFILCLLLATSASARVTFDETVLQRDKNEIRRVYNRLPKRCKTPDVSVSIGENTGYCGYYNDENHAIVIERFCVGYWTFTHEMGHHTMEATFTPGERDRWQTFWANNLELMPTPNAKTSPEEGFADCFRYYWLKRSRLAPEVKREMDRYKVRR